MTHFPQPHAERRATRVQFGGTIAATVLLEDGQRAKAKLQTVSTTGGLLRLARQLGKGDFVEVAFQTHSGQIRGMAEMLEPMRSTQGSLQPFRFIAMDDDDHRTLRMVVEAAADRGLLSSASNQWTLPKTF